MPSIAIIPSIAPPKVDSGRQRDWNPLAADSVAAAGSSYLGSPDGVLKHILDPDRQPGAAEIAVHDQLRERVLGEGYPCVGARSAFNRRFYRFGLYAEIGADAAARAVCHDLYEFSHEMGEMDSAFVTFIATFGEPTITSEAHFEHLLWAQLQVMHEIDDQFFAWDAAVSPDPEDNQFSFSIGGRATFIVGLNPRASRKARQFPNAALVFNLHQQFERLRERGKFEMFKNMIRARDMAFQGSINPVLENFGDSSEARQYSGRAVEDNWRCPFQPVDQNHAG
jgi:FPC/CPF motif-containing protein YcgG